MSDNVTRLPLPQPPEDPLEALKELAAEYRAASGQERNYGSSRFAHLFWWYVTELMPDLGQRRADSWAQREAAIDQIVSGPSRPRLRVVK